MILLRVQSSTVLWCNQGVLFIITKDEDEVRVEFGGLGETSKDKLALMTIRLSGRVAGSWKTVNHMRATGGPHKWSLSCCLYHDSSN